MKRIIIFCLLGLSLMSATAQVPNDTGSLRTMINTVLVPNGQKSVTARQMNEIFNGIVNLMKSNALDSAYKSGDTMYLTRRGGYPTIKVYVPGSGSISESDPTVPTAAKTLTTVDKTRWDNKQDKLTASSGTIAIEANVISAKNLSPVWNANKIMGRLITDAAPVTGQVLKWNGSEWAPAIDNNSGAAGTLASFDLAQFDTLGGTVKIKDSILEDTRLELVGNEDMVIAYDQGASKGKYIKAYLKGVLELLYTQDTLGVKIVRSFHEGYNTGGFSVRYVPGGIPDYVTSWPSKVHTGIWKRIDYNGEIEIEKIGALGTRNSQVTAATLGYTDQNLTDLFGTYFAKSTTDFIDQIALNQMIKSYSVGYRSFKLEPEQEYRFNSKLQEWPYHAANNYQHFKIIGSNSAIRSIGGKYTAFWRHPTNSTVANTLVHSSYEIEGLKFIDCDTGVAIHPSYRSIVKKNNFFNCRYGLVLRWDMAANVSDNNFTGGDSIQLAIWRLEGVFAGNAPQSNYVVGYNNRFESAAETKVNIDIYKSNGIVFEQTIFEGLNPDYNLHIDFTGGNSREIKFESVHCENIPDSAHIYFRGISSKLYLKKWYLQTNAVTIDAGSADANESTPVQVSFEDIPYWGGIPSFRHSGGAAWVFKNCTYIDVNSTTNWYGGIIPADIDAGFMAGNYKNNGVLTSIKGGLDVYSMKVFDGSSVFNKTLRVPVYTDSTTEAANDGRLMFHKDRSKLYYGQSTSWKWIVDSLSLFAPNLTAPTANGQTTNALNFAPNFSVGSFTGVIGRWANVQTSVSAGVLELRLANTSSTASSAARLQLYSNTASTGAGVLNISNNGDIQQAASNADLTLWSNGSGRSILFKTNGGATKGTFNATGFRIGDATAPTVAFEIGSTGAILLPKGTTAQRPTGVTGYGRYNTDSVNLEYFDGGWKQVASREWVRSQGYSTSGGGGTSSESFFQPVDADYTIPTGTGNYHVIYFEPLTAARTVTIPTETGRVFTIRHGGSGAFNINLSVNIYENSSTWVSSIGQGQSITFYYDGTRHVKIK